MSADTATFRVYVRELVDQRRYGSEFKIQAAFEPLEKPEKPGMTSSPIAWDKRFDIPLREEIVVFLTLALVRQQPIDVTVGIRFEG